MTEAERTTSTQPITGTAITSTERARIAARAADDKKGEDIVVLDVAEIMGIVDAFVTVSYTHLTLPTNREV